MLNENGFGALGFDLGTLIFQIINFGIVLFILRFIAYRPILRILESRRQKIEESLKAGTEMQKMKQEIHEERDKVLKETHREVQELIGQSREQAESIMRAAQTKAQEQSTLFVEKARVQAEHQLKALQEQFKKEAVSLVALATEHVLNQKIDQKTDEALIKQALSSAEKEL